LTFSSAIQAAAMNKAASPDGRIQPECQFVEYMKDEASLVLAGRLRERFTA
jgi:hypothetical protein